MGTEHEAALHEELEELQALQQVAGWKRFKIMMHGRATQADDQLKFGLLDDGRLRELRGEAREASYAVAYVGARIDAVKTELETIAMLDEEDDDMDAPRGEPNFDDVMRSLGNE